MNEIKYYDIGLNLFCAQFKHPEKVLQRAWEQNVACILTGSDPEDNRKIEAYLQAHPEVTVYGTAGLHPHNADHFTEDTLQEIRRQYLENPRIVAVGECGLDYNRMFSKKENQLRTLERFVELAEELNAPMFLHERDAAEDFAAVFRSVPKVAERSVVHCFTGNRKTVSMVTVTAAVPMYLSVHTQRREGTKHIKSAAAAQNTLLSTVKKRKADAPFLRLQLPSR